MYPADERHPGGKLRLLYEAAPIAMICECAGGRASTGRTDISEVEPRDLHERTPLYVGSKALVTRAEEYLARDVREGSEI